MTEKYLEIASKFDLEGQTVKITSVVVEIMAKQLYVASQRVL